MSPRPDRTLTIQTCDTVHSVYILAPDRPVPVIICRSNPLHLNLLYTAVPVVCPKVSGLYSVSPLLDDIVHY